MRWTPIVFLRRTIRSASIAALFILGAVGAVWAVDLYTFSQGNNDGFGVAQNRIDQEDHAVVVFEDHLYVSMENTATGAQIWRCLLASGCNEQADWEISANGGFNDPTNISVGMLTVFNGWLYAGTNESIKGAQIWRTQTGEEGNNEGDWEPVVSNAVGGDENDGTDESGFGLGVCCADIHEQAQSIIGSAVVSLDGSDRLFVGTEPAGALFYTDDGETWTQATNNTFGLGDDDGMIIFDLETTDTHLYVAGGTIDGFDVNPEKGLQIWACTIATGCDEQGDWAQIADPGFDEGENMLLAYDVEVFNNALYVSTIEESVDGGGQIWRCDISTEPCAEQADWEEIISNGFINNAANASILSLYVYANVLYATTTNKNGAQIWRSLNGDDWFAVATQGFQDDADNDLVRNLAVVDNHLLAFSDNTSGITTWIQSLEPIITDDSFSVSAYRNGSGDVRVRAKMGDPDNTSTGQMKVEYSLDGGDTFQQATLSTNDADTSAENGDPEVNNAQDYQIGRVGAYIDTSIEANMVTTHWASQEDAPDTETEEAQIRITTYDGYSEGEVETTANFEIDNADPVFSSITIEPSAAKAGDTLTITADVNEELIEKPDISIDSQSAGYQSVEVQGEARSYVYTYTVTGEETEGEAENLVFAYDTFFNRGEAQSSVVLDFTAPQTIEEPAAGAYNDPQTIALTASDDGAAGAFIQGTGVDEIYYTTDGSDPTTASARYAGPIELRETTTLKFFAVDAVGNQEAIQSKTFTIASSGPGAGDGDGGSGDGSDDVDSGTDDGERGVPIGGSIDTPSDDDDSLLETITDRVGETVDGFIDELRGIDPETNEQASFLDPVRELISFGQGEDASVLPGATAVALGVSAVNLGASAAGIVNYLRYLLQIITQPLRLLGGYRKRRWGIVFDIDTKQPIDLAIVRLLDADSGKLLQTSVTDRKGRYLFLVKKEGRYTMTVKKPEYLFPPETADRRLKSNWYTGGVIEPNQEEKQQAESQTGEQQKTVLQWDIPMSRAAGAVFVSGSKKPITLSLATAKQYMGASTSERDEDDKRIRWGVLGRTVARWISYMGPIFAFITFVREPSWVTALLLLLHILLLLLFRRLARIQAGKPWGTVVEEGSRRSLSRAVVRLFDTKNGKLLLAHVTSSDGRYAFLTDAGTYQLTANKDHYTFPKGVISIEGGDDATINERLELKKQL